MSTKRLVPIDYRQFPTATRIFSFSKSTAPDAALPRGFANLYLVVTGRYFYRLALYEPGYHRADGGVAGGLSFISPDRALLFRT